jgi:NAD(P)-dependent dehydrogenase (short-subunit alcohol dehydrogenase family)
LRLRFNDLNVCFARDIGGAFPCGPFLVGLAEAWHPKSREKQPVAIGRPANPPEIVTAALMLASPAPSFTTGSLVRVDGGQR